jgi:Leucine-rich repeat (LRR) protein
LVIIGVHSEESVTGAQDVGDSSELNYGSVGNHFWDKDTSCNVSLTVLCLERNQISGDISILANLTNLTQLYLCGNQVSDISLLMDNDGLSERDEIYLQENPLSPDSINIYTSA